MGLPTSFVGEMAQQITQTYSEAFTQIKQDSSCCAPTPQGPPGPGSAVIQCTQQHRDQRINRKLKQQLLGPTGCQGETCRLGL